jgi:tetratricopeptide (TPR) repeat protein
MKARTLAPIVLAWILFLPDAGPALPAGQTGSLSDREYRTGVLRKVADIVEGKYVLADRAKGFADAFRAKCASGSYDAYAKPEEFAGKVNADLVAITGDKHLNFRVIVPSAAGEKPASSLHHPVRYYLLRKKENAGFSKLEWVEPGIGYLDLRRFNSFGEARAMAIAAMTFLSNARAIIIDVRENGGGSGDYLSSFFLPYPTQLSGSYSRADGRLSETWTIRDVGMEPRTDVPLFVLTGPNTFSAAEAFAYDLKTRKRATLVGEPTKGGAHSVDLFGIDDRFEFYISTGRAVSPVTGGNWEGTGVLPDIAVPASSALDTAVREARKAAEAFGRSEDDRLKKSVERMQAYADDAARLYRKSETVSADAALNAMFEIARQAGLISEFFIGVFAYNFPAPPDERMQIAILERAIRFFPDSPTAYELLGNVHFSKGHTELALRYLQKAVALDPGLRDAANILKELQERK